MRRSRINSVFYLLTFAVIAAIFATNPAFAAEGEEHAEKVAGLPIIVWLSIANFIIFVSVLVFFLKKPLIEFLKGRKVEVGNEIEEARKILEEAQALNAEVSARIERLDSEIKSLRAEIVKEGVEEGERLMAKAQQAVERIRKEADFQADQEVKMARVELREEAARLAVELARKLLEANVNDSDRDRLLNDFINEVNK